jgi:hypothetical protein
VTISSLTPGATYFFAVTVYNNLGLESAFSNEIVYSVPNPSLVDSDGDGLSKLFEYAVGNNPTNSADANSGILVGLTQAAGNSYLAMKFKRRANAASLLLQYVPEVSGDNRTWNSDSANVTQLSVTPLDSQFDWVTVRDQTPTLPTTRRFIRLRVIQN